MINVARLGYRPDHGRLRTQKSSRMLLGGSPQPNRSASLERYELPIFDQGQCGSCTGHGSAQGVAIKMASMGTPLSFVPSPGGIYGPSRVLERSSSRVKLTDSGAMPSDVMVVLATIGVRPMRTGLSGNLSPDGRNSDVWGPDDVRGLVGATSNVNDEPDLGELTESGLVLAAGEHRIDENAHDAVTQVCAAIDAGYSVGIGVFVDSAFMNWNPSRGPLAVAPDFRDPTGGGHWLCLNAYDGYASGNAGLLRGPNSWGTSWGSTGHYEVDSEWLKLAASDIYIF